MLCWNIIGIHPPVRDADWMLTPNMCMGLMRMGITYDDEFYYSSPLQEKGAKKIYVHGDVRVFDGFLNVEQAAVINTFCDIYGITIAGRAPANGAFLELPGFIGQARSVNPSFYDLIVIHL